MQYHDFDIWLDNPTAEGYPLRASCEPHGEARDVSSFDPDVEPIRTMRSRLVREDTDKSFLTEFGTVLYSNLFTAKERRLEMLFERCRGAFLGSGKEGIRVRLHIEPPRIAALPWEFLYYHFAECFLATSIETPILRYIELMQVIRELKIQPPLRMLIAAPEGSGLDAKTETANLFEAIEGMEKQVTTRLLDKGVTYTAISDALRDEQFHVLHFIGHGEFQNDLPFVVLDDGRGGSEAADHERFGGLFTNHPTMKLVLLNSCKGGEVSSTESLVGMASHLVKRGVPAVIAMQYEIGDDQAVLFAREFYGALFKGWDKGRVEIAVSHARNSLLQGFPGDRVIGTPVLFSRAVDGLLFDLRTGKVLEDLPLTPAQSDTTKAAIRTREENVKALQNEPQKTDDLVALLREETAELRNLKLRLYLGKAAIVAACLLAPLLFGLFWLRVLDRLPPGLKIENYSIWIVEKLIHKTFSDQIALVPITDETARRFNRRLGDEKANWRGEHAALLERLSRAGAKVIAFDISFAEERDRELDERFSRAIRTAKERGTAVVAGIDDVIPKNSNPAVFSGDPTNWGLLCLGRTQGSTEILPLIVEKANPVPHDAVPSLALATVAAFKSWTIDGVDRQAMSVRIKDEKGAPERIGASLLASVPREPSVCTVLDAGDVVAQKIIDFTPRRRMRVPQRRIAYESILTWPDPQIAAAVNGKIVVVGFEQPSEVFRIRRGLGMNESFGYELHADAMNTLLRGINVRPIGQALQFLIILGLSFFGGLLWAWYPDRSRLRWRLLLTAAALYLGVVVMAYWSDRLLINLLYPLIALSFSYWALRSVLRRLRKSAAPTGGTS
jgi:CHASE2 domain-containing sensor protein